MKYKGKRPCRKKRPVVTIKANGEFDNNLENFKGEDDYHFNKPIDKYFKDNKVNKLIYETREEQKRHYEIAKLEVPENKKSFEEFYKKLKQEKIKPIIEK